MRSWLLMFLLLLSVLTHAAQSIRLIRKGSVPADWQHSIHEQLPGKRSHGGVEEGIQCKSKQCSGRIRKLVMVHISSTTTISKNDKNEEIKAEALSSTNQKLERKEENLSIKSSSKTQQGQPTPGPYSEVVDIAGMDYSLQGRRKPPIHN